MYQTGDTREAEHATTLPSGFKYVIGASALFIAICSAFFSVRGLGLLFVGSATAVMIMASSLEIGKLVAASFLYRYWKFLNRSLRAYLLIAVIALIAITSLGNYGFLARAYEKTHTQVTLLEGQITTLEKEVADTQQQIDAARGQLGRTTDAGREDITKLQQRITDSGLALEQSLARLQDRRTTVQQQHERDLQLRSQQLTARADVLKSAITSKDTAIADLNARVAVLDRAVDAYTKQGGPGFFKADSVKKGQELRDSQRAERAAIAAQVTSLLAQQEPVRTEYAKVMEATDKDLAIAREQFGKELAALDAEEKQLRQSHTTAIAQTEQQLAALQTQGKTVVAGGDTAIAGLYDRIRTRNEDIRHLREQIAATDIGSYRFVARALDADSDSVVKWLTLALVLVFDPLAVTLAVGFNVAMLRDRRHVPATLAATGIPTPVPQESTPAVARRNRWLFIGSNLVLLLLVGGALVLGTMWGINTYRQQTRGAHAQLIPADSFAVVSLHPSELQRSAQGQTLLEGLGALTGKTIGDALSQIIGNGVDPSADLYAFAKFPTGRKSENAERPVMLCGLVARVNNPAALETTLARLADQLSASLRTNAPVVPRLANGRAMIRHGDARYMDPEGGFFTFAITENAAIILLEFEGDPQSPSIENEIRLCINQHKTATGTQTLPARALTRDGVLALWIDANRFLHNLPKNPDAQARLQQLQRYTGFDLVFKIQPGTGDKLNLIADYAYQADRFKDRQQPTAIQHIAGLTSVEPAGIAGKLMDRCADTLDFDSLIERLRVSFGGAQNKGIENVVVEKTFLTDRTAQFVVTAQCNPQHGPALLTALNTIWE